MARIPTGQGPTHPDKKLVRYGAEPESAEKLGDDAAQAIAHPDIGIHGVSVWYRNPKQHSSCAEFAEVQRHFDIHKTLGRGHYTVELPQPVTQSVAETFNRLFKRLS